MFDWSCFEVSLKEEVLVWVVVSMVIIVVMVYKLYLDFVLNIFDNFSSNGYWV